MHHTGPVSRRTVVGLESHPMPSALETQASAESHFHREAHPHATPVILAPRREQPTANFSLAVHSTSVMLIRQAPHEVNSRTPYSAVGPILSGWKVPIPKGQSRSMMPAAASHSPLKDWAHAVFHPTSHKSRPGPLHSHNLVSRLALALRHQVMAGVYEYV